MGGFGGAWGAWGGHQGEGRGAGIIDVCCILTLLLFVTLSLLVKSLRACLSSFTSYV